MLYEIGPNLAAAIIVPFIAIAISFIIHILCKFDS